MANRKCGSCTKCCEGYLAGEVKGHTFQKGRACHFLAIGKGCTIYKERPQEPCRSYHCMWIQDETLPEWMKPEHSNLIVDIREVGGHRYLNAVEAGAVIRPQVLTWLVMYAVGTQSNLVWECDGGRNRIGSAEFCKAYDEVYSA